ncbi:UDP-N-acetylglucosamine pyrophosphorylase, putative [Entamoeba invadens IP1]|uniref:UDP-N-acetylglucosamine diphosphorylase n=2 Tax=Entamoeba invadens TaxID=33085 RepID=A0A0A1TVX3_ENTIV|nr:UDP-N-acetylglucosamine pyrophosphorylase, putative [Entamoeba invadens IP1]ELP84664.1 UDP-N-acetylglucosamine pyrophosphorylase, putative [Entamoeba invadens IP1]BAN41996.1 UDP-N-acetylglucosamine pyrophosphorylase, putative [Entamoeba invadens]|eukprot:XP_004184010.1 UDP-N-acetylglucosamine pyrophosphorylase, putative [Entamoeba invadens IP1]
MEHSYKPVELTTDTIPLTKEHYTRGLDLLVEGKAALITLAGGQGSRLGFEHPKGMFVIPLKNPISLFGVIAARLLCLQKLANAHANITTTKLHWFLMTNEETTEEIKTFFKDHNFFGLCENQIHFFPQGMLPVTDFNGKTLYRAPNEPFMAPNGHGGLYKALEDSGNLDFMEKSGIKYTVVQNVDNFLGKSLDPFFIGYIDILKADICIKSVKKSFKEEKMGMFVEENGKIKCVEYSELPEELNGYNEKGEFIFSNGHISLNCYTVDYLRKAAHTQLPFHIAKKKVGYIDETGKHIEPKKENAIKSEMFFFDAFYLAEKIILLGIQREEEFAAVKYGMDEKLENVETAISDYYKHNVKYLRNVGAIVDDSKSNICDISFTRTFNGNNLEEFKGKTIQLPFYLE